MRSRGQFDGAVHSIRPENIRPAAVNSCVPVPAVRERNDGDGILQGIRMGIELIGAESLIGQVVIRSRNSLRSGDQLLIVIAVQRIHMDCSCDIPLQ